MSAEATGWVWRNSPYTGAQLLVHLAIADVVNDVHDNEFWMSRANLALKARVARSTVTETLDDLQTHGLLLMIESGAATRKPSRFRFLMPPLARPTSGLVPETPLDRPAAMTRPVGDPSLGRSPAPNTKNENQESETKGDPNCFSCHGRGWVLDPSTRLFVRCECNPAADDGDVEATA